MPSLRLTRQRLYGHAAESLFFLDEESEREKGRERKREGEREKERGRKREGEKEREGERQREGERKRKREGRKRERESLFSQLILLLLRSCRV